MLLTNEKTDSSNHRGEVNDSNNSAAPPPYSSSGAGTETESSMVAASWTRANFLHIIERKKTIKGQWIIDPALQVPQALLPTATDDQYLENLHLESQNENVYADLALISEQPSPDRTYLCVKSRDGDVRVRIVHRFNQMFCLDASSWNDHVKVYIPRDFCGPVTFTSDKKTLNFSDAVKKQLTHIGTLPFIGNPELSGFNNLNDWHGDELKIGTHDGYAKIYFNDEEEPAVCGVHTVEMGLSLDGSIYNLVIQQICSINIQLVHSCRLRLALCCGMRKLGARIRCACAPQQKPCDDVLLLTLAHGQPEQSTISYSLMLIAGENTSGKEEVETPGSPPPYLTAAEASENGSSSSTSSWSRANLLYVVVRNKNIKGRWTIDPSLQVPEALRPTVSEGERLDNLHLESRNDNVQADIALVSEKPQTSRTYLFAKSRNGDVTIRIADRRNQRFCLEASSHSDDVRVYIPRDFRGPISFKSDHKTLRYSEAISEHLTQIGTLAFIGTLEDSGFESLEGWMGDELRLATHHGHAKLFFNDEEPGRNKVADFFKMKWV